MSENWTNVEQNKKNEAILINFIQRYLMSLNNHQFLLIKNLSTALISYQERDNWLLKHSTVYIHIDVVGFILMKKAVSFNNKTGHWSSSQQRKRFQWKTRPNEKGKKVFIEQKTKNVTLSYKFWTFIFQDRSLFLFHI